MALKGYETYVYAIAIMHRIGFLIHAKRIQAKTSVEWIYHFLCLLLLI